MTDTTAASPTAVGEEGLVDQARDLARAIVNKVTGHLTWRESEIIGICLEHIEASRARIEAEVIERCVRLIEKRAEDRFAEHGTREWDTNATYYEGAAAEIYESLDEEDEEIVAAIRALPITKAGERDNGDERD